MAIIQMYEYRAYFCPLCGAECKMQRSNGSLLRRWLMGAAPGKLQYQCQTTGCPNVGYRFSPRLVEVEAEPPQQ